MVDLDVDVQVRREECCGNAVERKTPIHRQVCPHPNISPMFPFSPFLSLCPLLKEGTNTFICFFEINHWK